MGSDCQQRGACFRPHVGFHPVLHSKTLLFEDTLGRRRYLYSDGKLTNVRRSFGFHSSQAVQVSAITQSGLVIAAVSQGLGKADEVLDGNVMDSTEKVSSI